jgi:hypothetical protein
MCWLSSNFKQKTVEEIVAEKSVGMTDSQKAQYWWELTQSIFGLLGKVDVPVFEFDPNTWIAVAQAQYPTLTNIKIADSNFFTTSLAGLQEILKRDWTNLVPYVAETGDCVTGDTPVWIRKDGQISLVEVRELVANDYIPLAPLQLGLEIFTYQGFVPLVDVWRKPKPRRTIRILGSSDIALTPDHKILANPSLLDGKYMKADIVSREHLIKCCPELPNTTDGTYELGWALGAFCAEGTALLNANGVGQTWSIREANLNYLERAQAALSQAYPEMIFYIKSYPSEEAGVKTNFGFRKSKIYHLLVSPRDKHNDGRRSRFVLEFRHAFYNAFKVKRVPDKILRGSVQMAQGFWNSMVAHDGSNGAVISNSKLETMGLAAILQKLDKKPVVLDEKRKFVLVHAEADNPSHFWGKNLVKHTQKANLWKLDNGTTWVYDLSTANGTFVAGDIAVKNCDKFATRLYSHLCDFYKINAIVPVWGDTTQGYHGFNLAIVKDADKFIARLIEPQTDAIFVDQGPLGKYIPRSVVEELGIKRLLGKDR